MKRDLQRWSPNSWNDIAGNRFAKRTLKAIARQLRQSSVEGELKLKSRLAFLLIGKSRSGKTSMVKFLLRCLVCKEFNHQAGEPCLGVCDACRQHPEVRDYKSYFALTGIPQEAVPVHVHHIDCTTVLTPHELRAQLDDLQDAISYQGLQVVYLDEVHRLAKRGMDELLLKRVEDQPYLWILSTAKPDDLEDMLLNRVVTIRTELPEKEELDRWLVDRCIEASLDWEAEAIMMISEKSNSVPGIALQALALAVTCGEALTRELVQDWQPSGD